MSKDFLKSSLKEKTKISKYGQKDKIGTDQQKQKGQDLEYDLQAVTYNILQIMHINGGIDGA